MQASREEVSAAAAEVGLARTVYLPKLDFYSQVNRATRNNVFGLLLPQSTLPNISGPPLQENELTSVWGSAVGALVSWEPFDFGQRRAQIATAQSAQRRAEASVERTRLEVASAAADAFLTLLAGEQVIRGARASVERARILRDVVDALVKSELRPGADASRIRAEAALAQTQLIQAEQASAVARAVLAQWVGSGADDAVAEDGPLLDIPPLPEIAAAVNNHPAAREQTAVIEEVRARRNALERVYFPRFNLQGATYARGTGALPSGGTLAGVNGLGPNIHNWAVGMAVTFPAFELPAIRARREVERHREAAEVARLQRVVEDLNSEIAKARAVLEDTRRVAAQTPIQAEAARQAEKQATARYRDGLGTIAEVAEAQRLVTQAEIDDSLARLGIWRALLSLAVALGDPDPFLKASK